MQAQPEVVTTSEERMLAALSHFLGLFIALIVWLVRGKESRFIRFQAAQAMAFDLFLMLTGLFCGACWVIVVFATPLLAIVPMAAASESDPIGALAGMLFMAVPFAMWCLMFSLIIAVFVVRVVAAILVLQGRDFHYPWLGDRLERFLESQNTAHSTSA